MRVKIYGYFIALAILMAGLVSCNGDGGSTSRAEKIEVEFLMSSEMQEGCMPRLVASYNGWSMMEITDPGEFDTLVLLFLKEEVKDCYLATIVDGRVSIACYEDILSDSYPTDILSVGYKDGKRVACAGEIDKETGLLVSMSYMAEDEIYGDRYGAGEGVAKDYFDDYDREIRGAFLDLFTRVGEKISDFAEILDFIPCAEAGSTVAGLWTDVFIPIAKASLYPDSYENLESIAEEQMTNAGKTFLVSLLPAKQGDLYRAVKRILLAYEYGRAYLEEHDADSEMPDGELTSGVRNIFSMAQYSNMQAVVMQENTGRYNIGVAVADVTENSARLSSSFSHDGTLGFISSTGYRYKAGDGIEQEITTDPLLSDASISSLEPGTAYSAYAFVRSMGLDYKSPSVSFTTLGGLSLYPEELVFGSEGGVKGVSLDYSREVIASWEIASSPVWCRIEESDRSFFVTVAESRESREGKIVVSAVTKDGGSVERSVLVSQEAGPTWDHTSWQCAGTLEAIYDDGSSIEQPLEFGIDIQSVTGNAYTLSGSIADWQPYSRIYCDEQGRLVLEYDAMSSSGGVVMRAEMKCVFTRAAGDGNKVTGTISGSSTMESGDGSEGFEVYGSFDGVLQQELR